MFIIKTLLITLLTQTSPIEFKPVHNKLMFDEPVQVVFSESEPNTMYVVEKDGLIRSATFDRSTTDKPVFLDITDRVEITNDEEGLLSFVFDPKYVENNRVYVWYSAQKPKRGVLSRFTKHTDRNEIDNKSEQILLEVPEPWGNHNGGTVLFGKDGFLYLGIGDGGSANDPNNNGQNKNTLLGSIIRIDVSSKEKYTIPNTNPLAKEDGVKRELWAWGLRNPWRMSFDRATGELWVGDVGQNSWEEVDVVRGGENFGWNAREGKHTFKKRDTQSKPFAEPIYEYGRRSGGSITGGYVYRGTNIPTLVGSYVFSDYLSKRIWIMLPENKETGVREVIRVAKKTPISIASFGETLTGEILACGFSSPYARRGKIYLLEPVDTTSSTIP
ncbi:MAG: glucose sorbosone dehydrogenase [Phycisphaerae bacterium]|jgi:glucose/arabinose dehydrogenase|nr:glucose sorbosone dehydrogenase [Phycisphaerae bacterium]